MQRLRGTSAIPTRPCEISYGILCSERYDRTRHTGQSAVKSELDGNKYAINQIHWFIRQGEAVTENKPIPCNYYRIFSPEDQNKAWRNKVVRSSLPSNRLPQFLANEGVEVICQIVSDLGPNTLGPDAAGVTTKRRHHIVGKKFMITDYELLAFVEQGGLRFSAQVNGEEKAFEVEWMTSQGNQSTGSEDIGFQGGFFRNP
jgi:hypothetical protein